MAVGLVAAPVIMPVTPDIDRNNQAAGVCSPDGAELKGTSGKAPRVGHKKSRNGCAQCKRRHVKCNEESPCANCVRHGVLCSLAGGPYVPRDDAKTRRKSTTSSSGASVIRTTSVDTQFTIGSGSTSAPNSAVGSPSVPSPFSVLTGLIDRPVSAQGSWQVDLELMHHYMTHTKYIIAEHDALDYILRIWQDELPKVAFVCDYVMHGLLGFTALHKAHMEPRHATALQAIAVDHLDKALSIYRGEAGPSSPENATAKFVFTWLVALFAYAVPPSVPPMDAMAELILLVKGVDAVLTDCWFWVAQGPFAPILTRGFQDALSSPTGGGQPIPEGIRMDFGLNHLDFMLGADHMLPDQRRVCAVVLVELKQLYDGILRSQDNCSVASIVCFPKQDSAAFASLIRHRVPQALIILSYYCVLLDVLDNRWWMSGWATRILGDVITALDETWKQWIEWPVECVLMKAQGVGVGGVLLKDTIVAVTTGPDISSLLV